MLELTESFAAPDDESMRLVLRRLKQLGVRLALDDFGSGYSSLARLQLMPLDLLKIDRQFVQSFGSRPKSVQLTRTIVELARTLGFRTTAEGIEQRDQLELARSVGCDLGQGFLLGRPLEADGIETLLSRHAPGRWLLEAGVGPLRGFRALAGGLPAA